MMEAAAGRFAAQPPPLREMPPIVRARPQGARLTAVPICPEIDCVRHLLPRRLVAAAERRAAAIGIGADRVLIAANAITEDAYLAARARSLGIGFARLDEVPRAACPLDQDQLIEAGTSGLLTLRAANEVAWIIAPCCRCVHALPDMLAARPHTRRSFYLTSDSQLRRFVARHAPDALGRRAADGLRRTWPLLSCAPQAPRRPLAIAGGLIALTLLAALPLQPFAAVNAILCVVFLAMAALRLATALPTPRTTAPVGRMRDAELPIYTIICALYREASVVEDLVAAIRRLDWPIEKLDVKLVLEPDDRDTARVLADLDLGPPFEIMIAPQAGPRTKPKALNAALPFARGPYTVIFDAEDRPEPDQLRRAFAALRADPGLACVQARLTIDNTADSWLTGMFTADYAAQFDVFLPGLAALGLPLPLGGSSNHFRTDVLREVGGWDAHNVTEDADLGMRLARFGYRSATLHSTTYEEAPATLRPWLRQRTRWFKGWMQTWLVHMRTPAGLLPDLGIAGALTFHLVIGGNVLAALTHPIFLVGLGYLLLWQRPALAGPIGPDTVLFGATLLSGYVASVALGAVGLRRRRLSATAWVLALMPLHWLLLSFAAWRALFQLGRDPHRWEKTEHGLARTSRLARRSGAQA
jgi:cellulose synthase/poly-beta-1,6-N-acetylglucosamine synthase-like glycosyltransferase